MDEKELKALLEEYVATANSGKYSSMKEVNDKFPEFKDFDKTALEEYVATTNSGKYKSLDEVNSKFPEFFPTTKIEKFTGTFEQKVTSPTPLTEKGKKTFKYGENKQLDFTEAVKTAEKFRKKAERSYYEDPVKQDIPTIDFTNEIAKVTEFKKKAEQSYYEDPSLQANRLRKEEEDNRVNYEKLYNEVSLSESLANTANNISVQLQKMLPQTQLVATDLWENVLGKELSEQFYQLEGRDINQVRFQAYDDLARLESQFKATKGNFADNFKYLKGEGLLANTAEAMGSLISTALPALITRGASSGFSMTGQSIYDYNKAKAESQGESIEDLYKSGTASIATPLAIGTLSASLELIGLKGVQNAVNRKLTGSFAKKAALIFTDVNKEGLTEVIQGGLEAANKAEAKSEDVADAFVNNITSKEGLNNYFGGVFGALGAAGLGRVTQFVTKPKNIEQANTIVTELSDVEQDLTNVNITDEVKETIVKQAEDKISDLAAIVNEDIDATDTQTPETKQESVKEQEEINALTQVTEDPSVSNTTKATAQAQIDEKIETSENVEDKEAVATVPEVVVETETTQETESKPIPKNIIEAIRGGEETIRSRKEKALENFRKSLTTNTGLNPETAAHALEYAILSIAEGSIKSAKALAKALGVKEEDVRTIYEDANAKLTAYREAEVTPDKKTVKSTIRESTEGGTKGKRVQTIRQAIKDFYTTYNKGIREGVKQGKAEIGEKLSDYKEGVANIKAVSRDLRNQIKGLLIEAKRAGTLKGDLKSFRTTNLSKVLATAETPIQLLKALDYTEKFINDVEYDNKVKKFNGLKKAVSKLAEGKLPVDLKAVLKDVNKLSISRIEDIDKVNSLLETISKLKTKPLDGTVDYLGQLQTIVDKAEQLRLQEIKDELSANGVPDSVINSLNTIDLEDLQNLLNPPAINKTTPKRVEEYKAAARTLHSLIGSTVDTSVMSEKEVQAVRDIEQIDIDKVAEKDLAKLVFGLTNLINRNKVTGLGELVLTNKIIRLSEDTSLMNRIKSNLRNSNNVFVRKFKRFRTGSNAISNAIKNDREVGDINRVTGMTDFKIGSVDYNKRKQPIIDKIKELNSKYEKAYKDPIKSMMLSIYADASQLKDSMPAREKLEEYTNRLVAWSKSLDRMKEKAATSVEYAEENKNFIETADNVLNQIVDITRDSDGNISSVNVKLNQAELFNKLGKPHQEFYKVVRDSYDGIKDDYFFVSEYFGNKDIDKDIQNYVFRGYKEVLKPQSDLTLDAQSEANKLKQLASGSSEGRSNWGQSLPKDKILDFDLMGRFESDISKMIYDIHTLEPRLFAGKSTNVGTSSIVEQVGSHDIFQLYNELLSTAVEQDAMQFGGNSVNRAGLLKVIGTIRKIGVSSGLAGVSQIAKQTSPIIDTAIRLQNPLNIIEGIRLALSEDPSVKDVLEYANVRYRDIYKELNPTNPDLKRQKIGLNKMEKLLKSLGATTEQVVEFTTNTALRPLQWTDQGIAKASWLSFYLDYFEGKGEAVDLTTRKEALDYADLMTSNVNNESDPRFKSKISRDKYFQTLLPFTSFAFNSRMDLINNLSKLGTKDARAGRNIAGNFAAIITYNSISYAFKSAIAGAAIATITKVISAYTDDEKEKEELLATVDKFENDKKDTNYINYNKNLIRDILFANIGSQFLDVIYNPISDLALEAVTSEETFDKYNKANNFTYQPSDFEKLTQYTGVATPFFSRLAESYKLLQDATETDKEFITKRKGFTTAEGDQTVDDYYLENKDKFGKPELSKKIDILSSIAAITSLTGASSQEVTAFRRVVNSLDKELVKKLRGKELKAKKQAVQSYLKDSSIEISGENGKEVLMLSPEMQKKKKGYYLEEVKKAKKDVPFETVKSYMTREEYEDETKKIAKEEADYKMVTEYEKLLKQQESKREQEELEIIERQQK